MDGDESNKVEAVGADGSREGGGIMDGVESNIGGGGVRMMSP